MLGPVVAGIASAVRHAAWWLEWHVGVGCAVGGRDLEQMELQPCESS
jgi:hypothetical protein